MSSFTSRIAAAEPNTIGGFQYDVVGYFRGSLGLAVAASNTVQALETSGRRARRVVVEPRNVHTPASSDASSRDGHARRLLLFHINPSEIGRFEKQWRSAVDLRVPVACVPFWEYPLIPRSWEPMLAAMQAILAPSQFVHAACSAVVPKERVLHYPQAVFPPTGIEPAREAWGLPPGATVFIVAFDFDSDIERKNPWAAVRAFQQAFPETPDVQLVIKVKLKPRVSRFAIQAANLRRMISGDPRIRIIETWLPYVDLLRLYASCDVLVSLHRSEGLGLHLMEAMSLGKVVVATGWSGNMDFMAADNSVLIPHELVPTASQHPSYVPEVGRDGQVWAEPDVAAAAEALRVLHGDANRRRALGAAAIRAMEERRRVMLSGATFEALEALLGRETGNVARFTAAVRRTRRTARARRPFFLLRMLDRMRARWRSQAR